MRVAKLLLALDGSDHSRQALATVAWLAPLLQSQVRVLHAVPTFEEFRVRKALFENAVAYLEKEGRRILDEAVSALEAEGVPHTEALVRGDPVEALVGAARVWTPDLVVLGSRGTSGSEMHSLGSVSFRVALHARASTLIVRGPPEIRRILVPLDRSQRAAHAADWAAGLAATLDASVALLFVIESDPGRVKFTVSTGYAEPFLKTTEDRLRKRGVRPRRMVKYGHPATEIIQQVHDGGFDLVVMGAQGVSGAPLFPLGGVTSRVMRGAPCSVAVVRPAGEGGGSPSPS